MNDSELLQLAKGWGNFVSDRINIWRLLYDRFPVAYAASRRNDNKLVFDTYDKALRDNPDAKPIFHSDRGY